MNRMKNILSRIIVYLIIKDHFLSNPVRYDIQSTLGLGSVDNER